MAKIIKTTVPEVSEIIEPAYDLFDITGLTLAEYVLIVALLGSQSKYVRIEEAMAEAGYQVSICGLYSTLLKDAPIAFHQTARNAIIKAWQEHYSVRA